MEEVFIMAYDTLSEEERQQIREEIAESGNGIWRMLSFVTLILCLVAWPVWRWVTKPIDLDETSQSYCVISQIKYHNTPDVCNNAYKSGSAKFIIALLQDAPIETRMRLASWIFPKDDTLWPKGLSKVVLDEKLTTDERIALYTKTIGSCPFCDKIERHSISTARFARLSNIIDDYRRAINLDPKERDAIIGRYHKLKFNWAVYNGHAQKRPFVLYGIYNVVSLLIFLLLKRPRYLSEWSVIFALFTPLVPIVEALLIIISYCLRPVRRLRERAREGKIFGKDVLKFILELELIDKRLRSKKLLDADRIALEKQRNELFDKIQCLKVERMKTLQYLQAIPPTDAEAITDLFHIA